MRYSLSPGTCDFIEDGRQGFLNSPFGIVFFHLCQIRDVADMVSAPIGFDVFNICPSSGQVFNMIQGLNYRTGIRSSSTDIVDLALPWALDK
jgi:hypothetical protein